MEAIKGKHIWEKAIIAILIGAVLALSRGYIPHIYGGEPVIAHGVTSANHASAREAEKTYNRLELSYASFASKEEFISWARGLCIASITHREICTSVPIRIAPTPKAAAVANFYLAEEGNRAEFITVDPETLKMPPVQASFLIAHEWNHMEYALITGTPKKYHESMDRAQYYYSQVDGMKLSRDLAMEIQTDCMTLKGSGQSWEGSYPYYLSKAVKPSNKEYNAERTCIHWKDVLYGDPAVDYSSVMGDFGKK